MAGVNKSLKAGSVVFKTGDAADGMYVVRRGELIVYLEQDGKEILLAKIPEGGIVGEMALFEKMPRSACVKAGVDSEITHISQADFTTLMKQIPKWFVGLMGALSSRLRSTNDRLQSLENDGLVDRGGSLAVTRKPYINSIRTMHTIDLIMLRDGQKDGKDVSIARKNLEDQLVQVFGESPARVQGLIEALVAETILVGKIDGYKNSTLVLHNRATLSQLAQFLTNFTKNNPTIIQIPESALQLLRIASKLALESPYDSLVATLEDISSAAASAGVDSTSFHTHIGSFTTFGDAAKTTKTSSKSGLGLRVVKSDIQMLIRNLSLFNRLAEKQLD